LESTQRVRERGNLSLPVVAIGSIPYPFGKLRTGFTGVRLSLRPRPAPLYRGGQAQDRHQGRPTLPMGESAISAFGVPFDPGPHGGAPSPTGGAGAGKLRTRLGRPVDTRLGHKARIGVYHSMPTCACGTVQAKIRAPPIPHFFAGLSNLRRV